MQSCRIVSFRGFVSNAWAGWLLTPRAVRGRAERERMNTSENLNKKKMAAVKTVAFAGWSVLFSFGSKFAEEETEKRTSRRTMTTRVVSKRIYYRREN